MERLDRYGRENEICVSQMSRTSKKRMNLLRTIKCLVGALQLDELSCLAVVEDMISFHGSYSCAANSSHSLILEF
jgi:hypothetical protein